MDLDILRIIFRWLHIIPVIVAIGGVVFLRMVLLPAVTQSLTEEQHDSLRQALRSRWRRVVHVCIVLILISGIYNIAVNIADKPPLYHALFGIKLLAALGVFFVASAVVGKSPAFESLRLQAAKWMGVVVFLALLIVLISGVMRNIPNKAPEPETAQRAEHISAQYWG